MKRHLTVFSVIFASGLLVAGCYTVSDKNVDLLPFHGRSFLVFGRVLNVSEKPVADCKVILIKRRHSRPPVPSDKPVAAVTDITGDYSFMFQPAGNTSFWLYFDAQDQGYAPQYICINNLIRSSMFMLHKEGNNPLNLSIILEEKGAGHAKVIPALNNQKQTDHEQ